MAAPNYSAQILKTRLRIERAERRGTLLASLGPLPRQRPMRPFARRILRLPETVEVWHTAHGAATPGAAERAA